MTFKIKLNFRTSKGIVGYEKTEYLAKKRAKQIARIFRPKHEGDDLIVYVEDCLGGLRAQYKASNPRRNLAGLS